MKPVKLFLAFAVLFALVLGIQAEDKGKKVKLKGKLVCGKCTLKLTDDCSNVLQVKAKGKTVNYFLDDDGKKAKYHGKICKPGSGEQVTVEGLAYKKGDQMHIKNPKVTTK